MTSENEFLRDFVVGLREDIKGIRSDIKEIILSINNHKIELENKATHDDLITVEEKLDKKADKKLLYKVSLGLLVLILIVAVKTNTANDIANFIISKG